jgi:hypothetical protein
MATSRVKTTYALDAETVGLIDQMARRWGTSKSDVLRRAVRVASEAARDDGGGGLAALERLQRAGRLSVDQARDWARRARAERQASARRREAGLP